MYGGGSETPTFQSTPPGWEATALGVTPVAAKLFQSTPPGWEATLEILDRHGWYLFQSTPPGWEATVKMDTPFHDMERIFILVINRTALY